MPEFEIHNLEMDIFEAVLVVVEIEDDSPQSLADAVAAWAEILPGADQSVRGHDEYDQGDGWFGFGAFLNNEVLEEHQVFERATDDPELRESTEKFVLAVIQFNHQHTGGEGLATHEELETGTAPHAGSG